MRERDIERYLVKRVGQMGGYAYKFTSPGRNSVPDRSVHLPLGVHCYVECKSPGEKLTTLQALERERLEHLGATVYWVDSFESVDAVLAAEWEKVEQMKQVQAHRTRMN